MTDLLQIQHIFALAIGLPGIVRVGDTVSVVVRRGANVAFGGRAPLVKSFGAALNQGSFATRYRVGKGEDWQVELTTETGRTR
ncbi:MAG: hypothetical protein ACKVZ0_19160 [Gemmatimonadales bacterium]